MVEVEVNVGDLDPNYMPDRLTGVFTALPSRTPEAAARANFLLHTNRRNDGLSHTISFHGNRTGYRFNMTSKTALDFSAEKM
jgi:hypothetical protein